MEKCRSWWNSCLGLHPSLAQLSCQGGLGDEETTVHKDWLIAAAVENSLDLEWWAVLMPSGFVGGHNDLGGRQLERLLSLLF